MTDGIRDAKGRFIKGHKSLAPRGPRGTLPSYRALMAQTVSEKDWVAILKKAVEQAKTGDATAREWLTAYLVGNPEQVVKLGLTDEARMTLEAWQARAQARRLTAGADIIEGEYSAAEVVEVVEGS